MSNTLESRARDEEGCARLAISRSMGIFATEQAALPLEAVIDLLNRGDLALALASETRESVLV
jgi:hypothetical protein